MNLLSCESLGHVSISVLPWSTTPLHLSLVFYLFSVLHVGCILLVGWRARGLYFTPALRWHLLRTKGRSAMLCMDPGNCKEWKDAPGDSSEFSADGRRTKPGGLFTTRSAQVKATVIWGRSARRARKGKSCKVVYFKMGAPMTWPPHLSHWFLLIEAFGSPVVVNQRHRPLNNRKTRCSYSTDTVRSTVPLFSSSKMEMDLIETELPDPEASFFFLFFCCFGFLPFTICKSILLSCIHWGNRCKLKIRLAI